MDDRERLAQELAPLLAFVGELDLSDPAACEARLQERFPLEGEELRSLRRLVRAGVEAGWLADREAGGIRFSRVRKARDEGDLSVDVVHMDRPGPGHTHPAGEVDLCFAVRGEPQFDGRPEGWTVYGPGSWHVPTVAGGVMDILYFLPGGAIRFEDAPS